MGLSPAPATRRGMSPSEDKPMSEPEPEPASFDDLRGPSNRPFVALEGIRKLNVTVQALVKAYRSPHADYEVDVLDHLDGGREKVLPLRNGSSLAGAFAGARPQAGDTLELEADGEGFKKEWRVVQHRGKA